MHRFNCRLGWKPKEDKTKGILLPEDIRVIQTDVMLEGRPLLSGKMAFWMDNSIGHFLRVMIILLEFCEFR